MIILHCPDCGDEIIVDFEEEYIKFKGDPSFCLCHISEEDIEKYGLERNI